MKTQIYLPKDNSDNELPVRLSLFYIFTQTFRRTKSIQLSCIEVMDIIHGVSKKALLERSKYETDDSFKTVQCFTDYFQEAYDIIDYIDGKVAHDYIRDTVLLFPQEPLPANIETDKTYPIQSDSAHDAVGSVLMLSVMPKLAEQFLMDIREMLSDDFFHNIRMYAGAHLDAPGMSINYGDREYTVQSKKSVKERRAKDMLEKLLDLVDDDD